MKSKYEEKLYLTKEEDNFISEFFNFIWEIRNIAQSDVLQECCSDILDTLNFLCEYTTLEEESEYERRKNGNEAG